jgi:hypothetical protein
MQRRGSAKMKGENNAKRTSLVLIRTPQLKPDPVEPL